MKVAKSDNVKTRDLRVDSMKGFLIFLVVFGHTIEPYIEHEPYMMVYTVIYSFHMPLFILISGYVFSIDSSCKKLINGLIHLGESLIVFQLLDIIFNFTFSSIDISFNNLITPGWTLWYLLSLILWRAMTYVLFNIFERKPSTDITMIIASFAIALIVGFIPITRELSFQRTFAFFPFFILGVLLRRYDFRNYIYNSVKRKSLLIAGGGIVLSISMIAAIKQCDYSELSSFFYCSSAFNSNYSIGIRANLLLLSLSECLIVFVTFSSSSWLAKLGVSSLMIYLFHTYIIRVMRFLINHGFLPDYFIMCLLYASLIVLVCFVFSKTKIAKTLINPFSSLLGKMS